MMGGPSGDVLQTIELFNYQTNTFELVDTRAADWEASETEGRTVLPLYGEAGYPEQIRLVRFAPGTRAPEHEHAGGEEIFVIDGSLRDEAGCYDTGTWLRFPGGSRHAPYTETGCTLYVKTGHL